jgi:hypothetical protein
MGYNLLIILFLYISSLFSMMEETPLEAYKRVELLIRIPRQKFSEQFPRQGYKRVVTRDVQHDLKAFYSSINSKQMLITVYDCYRKVVTQLPPDSSQLCECHKAWIEYSQYMSAVMNVLYDLTSFKKIIDYHDQVYKNNM